MPPVTNKVGMDALALISTTLNLTERLNRLNAFVKEKLIEEVKPIESTVLRKFNQVFQQMHFDFISQVFDENSIQSEIAYLKFWQTLFTRGRNLFTHSEIKIDARNFQETALVISRKAESISDVFLNNFSSALKLSFDVPKFLKEYVLLSSLIIELAERCFLEKELDVHSVTTRFFNLLGYQGQLLFYYKEAFNISDSFLNRANEDLLDKAIGLQDFFFNATRENAEISQSILKHYFYISFLKTIYKEKPLLLDAASQDTHLNYYFITNYNPLPLQFSCTAYFPTNYQVTIEHTKELPEYLPETVCQSIAGSSREQYEKWKSSLEKVSAKPLGKLKSKYTYRISNSYAAYQIDPYAYGYSPQGGGFYISGEVKNSIVRGDAFSYWGGDKHNYISTARHEAIHHDNYRTYVEFFKLNPKISNFLNRNWNEGLAVLFSEGACSKGYISQDMRKLKALNLTVLLGNEYIGYHESWIVNTYLINNFASFYQDLLTINKAIFFAKWNRILNADRGFHVWLSELNSSCRAFGLRDLTVDQNPSIYLDDYRAIAATRSPDILPSTASRSRILTPSGNQKQLSGPAYQDYLRLMHAINENNTTKINVIAAETRYPGIFNYRDPQRSGETPLHFVFGKYRGNCPPVLVKSLLVNGANPGVCQKFGTTAKQLAKQNCNNWLEIESIFDYFVQKPANLTTTEIPTIRTTTSNTSELAIYKPKSPALLDIIPLPLASFFSGALSASLDRFADSQKEKYFFLPTCMTYGLKPTLLAFGNSIYDSLILGPASAISLEAQWSSFLSYLVINYVGLVIAQPVSQKFSALINQKIINKYWNLAAKFALQTLTYMLFLNSGVFVSEEFIQRISLMVMMQVFNGMLFSAGEWGAHAAIDFVSNSKDTSIASGKNKPTKEDLKYPTRDNEVRFPLISYPIPASASNSTASGCGIKEDAIMIENINSDQAVFNSEGMGIKKFIDILETRLSFLLAKDKEGRLKEDFDNLSSRRDNYAEAVKHLNRISNKLSYAANVRYKRLGIKFASAKFICDLILERFRLLDLLLQHVSENKVVYVAGKFKIDLGAKLEKAQLIGEQFLKRSHDEMEKNSLFEDKEAQAYFFKYLDNLILALYDTTLFAHAKGYCENYKLTEIRRAIKSDESKNAKQPLNRSEDNPDSAKGLCMDLVASLRSIVNVISVLKTSVLKLKNFEDRKRYTATIELINQYVIELQSSLKYDSRVQQHLGLKPIVQKKPTQNHYAPNTSQTFFHGQAIPKTEDNGLALSTNSYSNN